MNLRQKIEDILINEIYAVQKMDGIAVYGFEEAIKEVLKAIKKEKKMKKFDKLFIEVADDYAADYDLEALFEELVPDLSPGQIALALYNAGEIPNDKMEKFINED